ncbi:MAG: GNAT family N-acetyltransferase, partial [Abditibacteriaceae bacterium]
DWWDYLDATITPQRPELGIDIHAGEMETSVMLALYPELVGDQRLEAPTKTQKEFPLTQRDLNIFGTGHFAPAGAIGYPSLASAEKGRAVIESVRAKMLPHLRDRLERLRTQPRYAGRGGIAVRNLTIDDLDAVMRLKTLAGWNQTEDDWRFILKNHDTDYFAAVHNGKVVGTAGAIRFGDALAWIGMVLVDPEFRRIGIARKLLKEVLDNLGKCPVVKLDATALGLELYEQNGFVQEYSLQRLIHPHLPTINKSSGVEVFPISDEKFQEVLTIDRQIFGADRSILLRALWEKSPDAAYCVRNQKEISGFCLGRRGTNFYQIGPVVATNFEDARVLISHAMRPFAGQAVGLDVPESQSELITWLQDIGFVTQRSFVRMARGEQSVLGVSEAQFAITGPEFG